VCYHLCIYSLDDHVTDRPTDPHTHTTGWGYIRGFSPIAVLDFLGPRAADGVPESGMAKN
jgi:hypothetical protein